MGNGEFLIEVANQQDAGPLIKEGFDFHVSCYPPQDEFTVVSIFTLRSYIEDDEFKKVLSQYGEIRREVIRLKYKADLAFAGLENGNRLVKVLWKRKRSRTRYESAMIGAA